MRIRPEHDIPLPADLLHATPEEIAELMAHKLYKDLALDTENIIIIDSLSTARGSVMVMNIRPDGELKLLRAGFSQCLQTIMAPMITGDDLESEMIADEASRRPAGVLRKDPMKLRL